MSLRMIFDGRLLHGPLSSRIGDLKLSPVMNFRVKPGKECVKSS